MTEVRRGTFSDLKQCVDFLEDYHKESSFADLAFDRLCVAQILEYHIASRDAILLISVKDDGTVTGLIAGSVEPFEFNTKIKYATDMWLISKGGRGNILVSRFKKWARSKGAARIIIGVSSSSQRADTLLSKQGFEKVGGIHVLR